jgi:7,8-dihydropterin-6-yl-methyl-4-(beta-D-ribofuranosyl)aminobenzene 5'-phosphate synthase
MNDSDNRLREVERIEIITLIDNYVDVLLRNTDVVTRPPLAKGEELPTDTMLAEHGLSLLVTVYQGENKHTLLFDTGYSKIGVPYNMKQMEIDVGQIEAIILSHGHMDHTGSFYTLIEQISKKVPIVVHPGAFHFPRYFGLDDGRRFLFPRTLVREALEERGVEILESRRPTFILEDMVAVTGEVERTTEFEQGLPNATMELDGKIQPDPISDDQALVLNLKGKGLVVISGCSHAGIINTVLFSRKFTDVEKIHGVLGGFHLSGPFFEPIIEKTIEALKEMAPEVIMPMHCTGWKAIQRFSEEFPSSFVLNSVGSKITLS